MSILAVLAANLRLGPRTLRFPAVVPAPRRFRGLVRIDLDRCVGCATCSYVCVSAAITTVDQEAGFDWSYDGGRCTFCARCADFCPAGALSLDQHPAASYAHKDALQQAHNLPYPPCPECGRPTRPARLAVLERVLSPSELRSLDRLRLCERCRRKRTQRALLIDSMGSEPGSADGR